MPENPVYLKLQWAEKRLRDLDSMIHEFGSRHQRVSIERNSETNELVYRLDEEPDIKPDIPLLAGDIVQCLRTALDYLACALVRANGNKVSDQTCFPISHDAPSTPSEQASFARKVRGMGQEAINLIRAINPYKGGCPYLWHIHELNRREKHRLLFTVGAYVNNFGITQHIDATNPPLDVLERMARAYASSETWIDVRKATYPLKKGDVLLIDRPDAKPNENIQFSIQVALNELGVFEGEPLFPVVWQASRRVWQVVSRFNGMY